MGAGWRWDLGQAHCFRWHAMRGPSPQAQPLGFRAFRVRSSADNGPVGARAPQQATAFGHISSRSWPRCRTFCCSGQAHSRTRACWRTRALRSGASAASARTWWRGTCPSSSTRCTCVCARAEVGRDTAHASSDGARLQIPHHPINSRDVRDRVGMVGHLRDDRPQPAGGGAGTWWGIKQGHGPERVSKCGMADLDAALDRTAVLCVLLSRGGQVVWEAVGADQQLPRGTVGRTPRVVDWRFCGARPLRAGLCPHPVHPSRPAARRSSSRPFSVRSAVPWPVASPPPVLSRPPPSPLSIARALTLSVPFSSMSPQILHSFRQSVDPEQWERYLAGFQDRLRRVLTQVIGRHINPR